MVGFANWHSQQGMQAGDTPWLLQGANTAIQSGLQGVNRGISNLTGELQKQQNSSALGQLLAGANTAQDIRDRLAQNPELFNRLNPDGQKLFLGQQEMLDRGGLINAQASNLNAEAARTNKLNTYIDQEEGDKHATAQGQLGLWRSQGHEADAAAGNFNSMAAMRSFQMNQAKADMDARRQLALAEYGGTPDAAPMPSAQNIPDVNLTGVMQQNRFGHVLGLHTDSFENMPKMVANHPNMPDTFTPGTSPITLEGVNAGLPPEGYSPATSKNIASYATWLNNVYADAQPDTARSIKAKQLHSLIMKNPNTARFLAPEDQQLLQGYYLDSDAMPDAKTQDVHNLTGAYRGLPKDNQGTLDTIQGIYAARNRLGSAPDNLVNFQNTLDEAAESKLDDKAFADKFKLDNVSLPEARARVFTAAKQRGTPESQMNDEQLESRARQLSVAEDYARRTDGSFWPGDEAASAMDIIGDDQSAKRRAIINKYNYLRRIESALRTGNAIIDHVHSRQNDFGQSAVLSPRNRMAASSYLGSRAALYNELNNAIAELDAELKGRRSPAGVRAAADSTHNMNYDIASRMADHPVATSIGMIAR